MNAPLIADVGSVSPAAREFLGRLSELAPAYYEIVEEEPTASARTETEAVPDPASEPSPESDHGPSPKASRLEDWL
ncbi:MAG: hypothetical protein UZ18_ATM001001484 [Armatimonadetes bacterium OLB18]|nr:MAG: hypothetical protein UZ18_ATM001001484 [Armatimonadetes bacterium OLB18]